MTGRVAVLLYFGPVGDRIPDWNAFASLLEVPGADVVLVVADSATAGFRLRLDDVIAAAAIQIELLTRQRELADRVVEVATRDERRLVSLGVARIDVSSEGIRRCARGALLRRLARFLSDNEPAALSGQSAHESKPPLKRLPVPSVDDYLRSAIREAGGRLGVATESLSQAVGALSGEERAARVRHATAKTRFAIASALRLPPPMPRSWWRRFWDWLLGRRPSDAAAPLHPAAPTPVSSSAELAKAELRRLQVLHLLKGIAANDVTDTSTTPWEVSFLDHPDGPASLEAVLPAVEQLAWQLTSEPLDRLLADGVVAERLHAQLGALCDEALRVFDARAAVSGVVIEGLVQRAATAASPVAPWGGASCEHWCLQPTGVSADWLGALRSQAFQPLGAATTGDIVLATILSQVTPPATGEVEEISDAKL